MTTRSHAANPGRHSLAARGDDLYETPAEAVHALMRVEHLPLRVWEPACGPGAIVRVLRESERRTPIPFYSGLLLNGDRWRPIGAVAARIVVRLARRRRAA
jgi:hypothetical protein